MSEADTDSEFCVVPEAEDAPQGSSSYPFGAIQTQSGHYVSLRSSAAPPNAKLVPKRPRRIYTALKKLWLDELLLMKAIRCPVPGCNGRFTSLYNMQTHYENCKGLNNSGILQCPLCGEAFYSLSNALEIHFTEVHPHEKITPDEEARTTTTPRHPATELFMKQVPPERKKILKKPITPQKKTVRFKTPEPPPAPEASSIDLPVGDPSATRLPGPKPEPLVSNRRRTYSRSLNEPCGPTSEIIRFPSRHVTFDDEDSLQLPRFMLEMDINLPADGSKPKKRRYVNDFAPEEIVVDTSDMPDVEQLPAAPLLQKIIKPPRKRRTPKADVKLVQVVMRSSDTQSTSILSNPKLINAIVGQALKLTNDPSKKPSAPPIVVALNKATPATEEYATPNMSGVPNVIKRSVSRQMHQQQQQMVALPQQPQAAPDFDAVFNNTQAALVSPQQYASSSEGLASADGSFFDREARDRSLQLLPATSSASYNPQAYSDAQYNPQGSVFLPLEAPPQQTASFVGDSRDYFLPDGTKAYMSENGSVVYTTDIYGAGASSVAYVSQPPSFDTVAGLQDVKPSVPLYSTRTDVGIQAGEFIPNGELQPSDLQIIETPSAAESGQRTLYLVDSAQDGDNPTGDKVYIVQVGDNGNEATGSGNLFLVSENPASGAAQGLSQQLIVSDSSQQPVSMEEKGDFDQKVNTSEASISLPIREYIVGEGDYAQPMEHASDYTQSQIDGVATYSHDIHSSFSSQHNTSELACLPPSFDAHEASISQGQHSDIALECTVADPEVPETGSTECSQVCSTDQPSIDSSYETVTHIADSVDKSDAQKTSSPISDNRTEKETEGFFPLTDTTDELQTIPASSTFEENFPEVPEPDEGVNATPVHQPEEINVYSAEDSSIPVVENSSQIELNNSSTDAGVNDSSKIVAMSNADEDTNLRNLNSLEEGAVPDVEPDGEHELLNKNSMNNYPSEMSLSHAGSQEEGSNSSVNVEETIQIDAESDREAAKEFEISGELTEDPVDLVDQGQQFEERNPGELSSTGQELFSDQENLVEERGQEHLDRETQMLTKSHEGHSDLSQMDSQEELQNASNLSDQHSLMQVDSHGEHDNEDNLQKDVLFAESFEKNPDTSKLYEKQLFIESNEEHEETDKISNPLTAESHDANQLHDDEALMKHDDHNELHVEDKISNPLTAESHDANQLHDDEALMNHDDHNQLHVEDKISNPLTAESHDANQLHDDEALMNHDDHNELHVEDKISNPLTAEAHDANQMHEDEALMNHDDHNELHVEDKIYNPLTAESHDDNQLHEDEAPMNHDDHNELHVEDKVSNPLTAESHDANQLHDDEALMNHDDHNELQVEDKVSNPLTAESHDANQMHEDEALMNHDDHNQLHVEDKISNPLTAESHDAGQLHEDEALMNPEGNEELHMEAMEVVSELTEAVSSFNDCNMEDSTVDNSVDNEASIALDIRSNNEGEQGILEADLESNGVQSVPPAQSNSVHSAAIEEHSAEEEAEVSTERKTPVEELSRAVLDEIAMTVADVAFAQNISEAPKTTNSEGNFEEESAEIFEVCQNIVHRVSLTGNDDCAPLDAKQLRESVDCNDGDAVSTARENDNL